MRTNLLELEERYGEHFFCYEFWKRVTQFHQVWKCRGNPSHLKRRMQELDELVSKLWIPDTTKGLSENNCRNDVHGESFCAGEDVHWLPALCKLFISGQDLIYLSLDHRGQFLHTGRRKGGGQYLSSNAMGIWIMFPNRGSREGDETIKTWILGESRTHTRHLLEDFWIIDVEFIRSYPDDRTWEAHYQYPIIILQERYLLTVTFMEAFDLKYQQAPVINIPVPVVPGIFSILFVNESDQYTMASKPRLSTGQNTLPEGAV